MTKKTLAGRISLITITLVILCACGIGGMSFIMFRKHNIAACANQVLMTAQGAATMIDGDLLLESIETGVPTEYWFHVKARFNQLITDLGVKYLYALEADFDSHVTYIAAG